MQERPPPQLVKARIRASVAAFAAAGALAVVELVNRIHGDLLGQYFAEYEGGGSYKWRGEPGESFQTVLMVSLGIALVASCVAAPNVLQWWRRSRRSSQRLSALVCITIVVCVWARLLVLRVPAAAFETGP